MGIGRRIEEYIDGGFGWEVFVFVNSGIWGLWGDCYCVIRFEILVIESCVSLWFIKNGKTLLNFDMLAIVKCNLILKLLKYGKGGVGFGV